MTVIVAALSWSWRETEVDPLTGAVRGNLRDRGPSGSELAALEHALRLAERWDARVVAATVAPAGADEMLRDALAVGAAQALRVEPARWMARPRPSGLVGGERESAAALASALRYHYGVPDLVLCGDLAADRATGSFPAFLAASLGAAQALGCVRLEPVDERALRVHRRLDGGRREVLIVRPPAVVSIEAAGVRLRRAGLPATLSRHNAPITVADAPAAAAPLIGILAAHPYRPRPRELPGPTGTALRRTLELTGALAQRTPPTVVGPLSPGQAADELLGYLRRQGYLAEDRALSRTGRGVSGQATSSDSPVKAFHSEAYVPSAASSSSWLPISTIRPWSRTTIRSARAAVVSRCATTSVVRAAVSSLMA